MPEVRDRFYPSPGEGDKYKNFRLLSIERLRRFADLTRTPSRTHAMNLQLLVEYALRSTYKDCLAVDLKEEANNVLNSRHIRPPRV